MVPVVALAVFLSLLPPAPTSTRTVARGVTLTQEVVPETDPAGPLLVHLLRIEPGVRVEAALGQDTVWSDDATFGREAVSRLGRRRGAAAGVNAGFFPFAGNPIGLHIENGEMVTEPALKRSSLVQTADGAWRVAAFDFRGSASVGPASVRVDGLNRRPGKGTELLVFSPRFAAATLPAVGRVEVVLDGAGGALKPGDVSGTVAAAATGGRTPLRPGTLVLSGGGDAGAWLEQNARVGTKVTVRLDVHPLGGVAIDPATIRQAVTAAPRLVRDGKVDIPIAAEQVRPDVANGRHPRTAAGIAKDGGLILIAVDGRQKGLSRGMTLAELAERLIAEGAVEAVNLDGGGSTACIAWNGVVNSPSDGAERPVADALLVFAEPVAGDGAALRIPPLERPLAVGDIWTFALPDGIDPRAALWGTGGGIGFVSQDGVFHALRAGKGSVQVRVGGKTTVIPVDVSPPSPTPAR